METKFKMKGSGYTLSLDMESVVKMLEDLPDILSEVADIVAYEVLNDLVARTPVGIRSDKTHRPGTYRRSWRVNEQRTGKEDVTLTFTGGAGGLLVDYDYGVILDKGLYPGVGRRTVVGYKGGIYSRQAPGGIIRQTMEEETERKAFVEGIKKKILPHLIKRLRQAVKGVPYGTA